MLILYGMFDNRRIWRTRRSIDPPETNRPLPDVIAHFPRVLERRPPVRKLSSRYRARELTGEQEMSLLRGATRDR